MGLRLLCVPMALATVVAGEEVTGGPRDLQNFEPSSTPQQNTWLANSYHGDAFGSKARDQDHRGLQAVPGEFCSDPDNEGAVCNIAKGCACFNPYGCVYFIERYGGGDAECEEDLTTGPAYDAPLCSPSSSAGDLCSSSAEDIASGCATPGLAGLCLPVGGGFICATVEISTEGYPCMSDTCLCAAGLYTCMCGGGVCFDVEDNDGFICATSECVDDAVCGDPHMKGLRGQKIDWSGVNGGWYSLVKDDDSDLHINVRLTAPLPDEFPNRQLITGLSILSEGHSLAIDVTNPYTIDTDGCPMGISPCLANGGLRAVVDGYDDNDLLHFSRQTRVAGGAISVSASNLPVECRQFSGDRIWARMYDEMLQDKRTLTAESEPLEDWILSFQKMAAPEWCTKYIVENNLGDLQSTHAVFKIETATATVRLNAGVNYQGGGELDWDGRVLPDLEFWQMDIGLDGLDIDNPSLSGILGETARPVYDEETGHEVMQGFEAFRGDVEDYRVAGSLGTHFALLDDIAGEDV